MLGFAYDFKRDSVKIFRNFVDDDIEHVHNFLGIGTTMAPPPSARAESSHMKDYNRFLTIFFQSQGAAQILIVSTLFAIGTGSVLGLVRRRRNDDR